MEESVPNVKKFGVKAADYLGKRLDAFFAPLNVLTRIFRKFKLFCNFQNQFIFVFHRPCMIPVLVEQLDVDLQRVTHVVRHNEKVSLTRKKDPCFQTN